jgi:Zn-dependent peptidase ImmA (M78 family)
MDYHLTPLEEAIRKLFINIDIFRPTQLDLCDIANRLGIYADFSPGKSGSFKMGLDYIIKINSLLSREEQWQTFGHEICHFLWHKGCQLKISESFKELQERNARNFAFQFCVPTFMILDQDIPKYRSQFVYNVAEQFNVTHKFADKRVLHYEKQVTGLTLQEQWTKELKDNEMRYL